MENNNHIHPKFNKEITAGTLASGVGGGTLALQMNSVRELCAIDNWDVAQKAFEYNFKDNRYVPFWLADLTQISANDILRRIYKDPGELDIMLLSPPCQGFSVAKGKLNPLDKRNAIFLRCLEHIAGVKPKVFIIENVPGMNDPRLISIFNEIKLRIIEQLNPDYEVRCYKILALNHNTPQLRHRLIFVGYLKTLGVTPTPPEPKFDGIENLRIVDITPEITALKVGQSKKIIKSNTKYMNTITASGEVIAYVGGEERNLSVNQNRKFATFPEWFELPAEISEKEAQVLFGNTIPPNFMASIIEHILNQVGEKL